MIYSYNEAQHRLCTLEERPHLCQYTVQDILRACENTVSEKYLLKKNSINFYKFCMHARKYNLFVHEFAPFVSHFPAIPEVGGGADAGQTADCVPVPGRQ